ncbi:MAG: hypothetical protein IPN85_07790 [Flavobacteriales bacterium]|nr:hypothetical protein [Flavobacteriales bacterium]
MNAKSTPIRSTASVWMLLVLFLVGTALPAVSRMTCLMSGHSELSVGQAEECCPDEAPTTGSSVKPVCCEVLTAKPTSQPFRAQWPVLLPISAVHALVFVEVPPPCIFRTPSVRMHRWPPPLGDRLAAIGVLLI